MYMTVRKLKQVANFEKSQIHYSFGTKLMSDLHSINEYNQTIDNVLNGFKNQHSTNSLRAFVKQHSSKGYFWIRYLDPQNPEKQKILFNKYLDEIECAEKVRGPLNKLFILDSRLTGIMTNNDFDCQNTQYHLLKFNFEKFSKLWLEPFGPVNLDDKIEILFNVYPWDLGSGTTVDLPLGVRQITVNNKNYYFSDKNHKDMNFFYMYFTQIADDMSLPDLYYKKVDLCVKNYRQRTPKKQRKLDHEYFHAVNSQILTDFDYLEFILSN